MEKNEESRASPALTNGGPGDSTEVEKFKRRLIRAVARMLLHEKRNEAEVWTGLKKETGCDCQLLWSRMYALTIKKLNRLLEAEDRVDMLPAAARMSITDWLLCDTVLVHHDDFDVVGMTDTTTQDRKVLLDLFELVEKHKIEFLAGMELADAWSALTVEYNQANRQCTPMLLQRRWYQLKLATRARFYKFWSMYKGVVKNLHGVEMYKPTPLQTDIAKKEHLETSIRLQIALFDNIGSKLATGYKPLVIMPFMQWEDLVKNKLVILPEEFERRGMEKNVSAEENTPDVLCLEPDLETIDLDIDSDSELEYRKPPSSEEPPAVTIKQEPKDIDEMDFEENVPYENRQEKIFHFAEAVMEATAMELNQIDLEDNKLPEEKDDEIEVVPNENIQTLDENNKVTIVNANKTNLGVVENIVDLEDAPLVLDIDKQNDTTDVVDTPQLVAENIDSADVVPITDDIKIIENKIEVVKEPEIVLPQITSVFGGVDESNETLSKIGMLTAQITTVKTTIIDKDVQVDKNSKDVPIHIRSDSIDDMPTDGGISVAEDVLDEDSSVRNTLVDNIHPQVDVKPDISKNNWYGELSNDIDFADDGIQLVDDGIAYHDDEFSYQIGGIKIEANTEKNIEDPALASDPEDDTPRVDKKLLMVPQVLTVKLDDMGILPINLLQHVDNKTVLDMISFKSKPVIKEIDTMSKSSEESLEQEIKKVKMSSNLLQKPRSRSYNPVQLCKNPDFNIRLKRLSIGFFSSSRNCCLYKACKPLTIDVSKAFERRLVNGTIYLDPVKDENAQQSIDLTENTQNVSVLPSAMPVQSLIDNNKGEINLIAYHSVKPNSVKRVSPVERPSPVGRASPIEIVSERSKTINLPDITEIRRINQKLLTAEVTPLQLKDNVAQVPVSLVPTPTIDNIDTLNTNLANKRMVGPASRTKLLSKVVDITKNNTVSNSVTNTTTSAANVTKNKEVTKPIERIIPWKPRQTKEGVSWSCTPSSIYTSDTLLALDTLNKMLYLLCQEDVDNMPRTSKKNRNKESKRTQKSDKPKDDGNDDVQIVGETKLDKNETKKPRKTKSVAPRKTTTVEPVNTKTVAPVNTITVEPLKPTTVDPRERKTVAPRNTKNVEPPKTRQRGTYCCWVRERILQLIHRKRRISNHNCPYPLCLCCCKSALKEYCARQKENREAYNKHSKCIGTQLDLEPVQRNVSVDTNTDAAVIIPIVQNVPETIATMNSLPTEENKNHESSANLIPNDADVVCSDESTLGEIVVVSEPTTFEVPITSGRRAVRVDKSTSTEEVADCNETTITEAPSVASTTNNKKDELTPDVTIIIHKNANSSSEASTNTKTVSTTKRGKTNMPPPSLQKTRFRVKSSSGPYALQAKRRKYAHQSDVSPPEQRQMVVNTHTQRQFVLNTATQRHSGVVVNTPVQPESVVNTPAQPQPVVNSAQPHSVVVIEKLQPQNAILKTDPVSTIATKILLPPLRPRCKTNAEEDLNISYPNAPKLATKTYTNQKMIYLNSKQISERPTDNPIFLGKNKILLTTAKFPPNFKAFEAFQRNIRQTLALPKGIQLLLQPSGRVTYTRDPKSVVSDEFMTSLPHLVRAVQQQIDVTIGTALQASITTTQPVDEVINLSDDEPSMDTENSDKGPGNELKDSTDQSITNSTLGSNVVTSLSEIQVGNVEKEGSAGDSTAENTNMQVEPNNHTSEDVTQGEQGIQISTNEMQIEQSVVISENKCDMTTTVESSEITKPQEIGDSSEITNSKELSKEITKTEEVKESSKITKTQEIGDSSEITNSKELSKEITKTEEVKESTEITKTQEIGDSSEITNSKELSKEITNTEEGKESTEITYTQNIGAYSEIPKIKEISSEITNENEVKKSTDVTEATEEPIETTNIKEINKEASTESVEERTEIKNTKDIIPKQPKTTEQTTGANGNEANKDNESEANESNSGMSNDIIRDIMALSGIDTLDEEEQLPTEECAPAEVAQPYTLEVPAQPIQPTVSNTTATTLTPLLPQEGTPTIQIMGAPKNDDLTNTTQVNVNVLPQALTAITSLSELKYACSQNGVFFKLDLDTGFIVPINVCMKKFEARVNARRNAGKKNRAIAPKNLDEGGAPKPVIDLTDDDGPEAVVPQANDIINQTETEDQTNAKDPNIKSPLVLNSLLISNNLLNLRNSCPSKETENTNNTIEVKSHVMKSVKPIKVFKSGRPNILARKLKEIQAKISKAMSAHDLIRRQIKRKQELTTLDSEPRVLDPKFGQLTVASDSSSDEEPLSKVAIKMRATENTKNTHKKKKTNIAPVIDITETDDVVPVPVKENPEPVVIAAPVEANPGPLPVIPEPFGENAFIAPRVPKDDNVASDPVPNIERDGNNMDTLDEDVTEEEAMSVDDAHDDAPEDIEDEEFVPLRYDLDDSDGDEDCILGV